MDTYAPSPSSLPPQLPAPGELTTQQKDDRNLGMLCHLLGLAGFGIPFGHIAGPLIIWLSKKDSSPVVDREGKEALNFQISVTIYALVAGLLCFVLVGLLLLPLVALGAFIFTILASVEASKGNAYRYPLTIRFLQ